MPAHERSSREWTLTALLALEIVLFGFAGGNFFSAGNFFEVLRLSVELGLLALAVTPTIITGGIDLSVGSMMGLAAVVLGKVWRDGGLPIGWAVLVVLLLGLAGGGLNALLIARFRLPPLIVTLGTYSLFRGFAEGLTGGAESFSNFPPGFLFLGQGYIGGVIPTQALILAAAAAGYWFLQHRTVIGRGLYAIGCSPSGALYGAVPVVRRLAFVYVLSGLLSSVSAIVYVAHLGQAKSDAGTGYELMAITAVVLGGTSIFGGEGTIHGAILGLFAIVILQNGLRLAALPSELAGILTGVLLAGTIGFNVLSRKPRKALDQPPGAAVKNSQVAILCAAVLASGLLVAGSNWMLMKSIQPQSAGPSLPQVRKAVIAVMPKAKGDPYFVSCREGVEEAQKELGVDVIWDGPTDLDPAKQSEVVEGWITRQVDAIAVSVLNGPAISTVLRKAREHGIKVVTWDADAEANARDFFINQATPEGIGNTLTDRAAQILGGKGEIAIVTGALSAANQNEWIRFIRKRLEKYPGMKLDVIRPSDDDRDKAFAETQTLLKVYPGVRVVVAIAAPAVPGAAEAVKQSGRTDVKVVGLSLPNVCKPYVHAGIIDAVILWKTRDLGYLVVQAANALTKGELKAGDASFRAGRLGALQVSGSQVILGSPFIFDKSNIDRFDF
ncbi:MAG TPA: substrate-binding domain-containing protein [Bryobacteraceae bacterium]|nr:substrate-binding domain-containing protein [Bryobacteraceae bacterium]